MVTIESKRWDEIPNGLAMKASFLQFEKDSDYLEDHRKELLVKYPDEWVAVYEESVVAHAPTLDEFFRNIEAAGAPPTSVAKHFFSSKPITLIV